MMYHQRVDYAKRNRLQTREATGSLCIGKAPRFARYEMERPYCANASFHEPLRDLGLANSASSTMIVALLAILIFAAPFTISSGGLAVQEALLNSALNTVGFDGLALVFLTSVGAEERTCVHN